MVLLNTKQSFPESLNDIHNHLKRYPHHSILKSQPSLWSIDDRLKTDSLSLRRLSTNDSMPSLTKSETAYSSDSTFDHRRHCVLQEWLMTEKAYLADLELIQEIYMNPHVFSQSESRQIFLNLPEIILFSREWIVAMETHLSVGALCNTMMHTMEQVYTEFCIKHQDSLQRLHVMIHTQPLIHRFIKQSNKQLSGRTTCWDLESLLIKPVQRILKYPLLIKELIQSTPKQHEDYDQLILALHNIKQIANQINETKRRKDFVEQLIHPKHKNNVIYHLHKKLNRKKNKVICQTHDSQFDALYHTFQQKQALAHELKQAIEDWLLSIRENVEALSCLVDNLESIYDDSDGIGLRSIQSLKSLVAHLEAYPWATFVQHNIYRQMDDYLKTFRNPEQVIQKRKKALVAYDTMLYSTKTSDEKELHVSYSVYCSLNQVLLDELPVFFKLCDAYFDILLQDFATLQSSFYRFQQTEWKVLTAELPFGRDHGWSSIQDGYLHSLKRLQIRLNEIQSIRQ